jgi:hypothetical protein
MADESCTSGVPGNLFIPLSHPLISRASVLWVC